MNPEPLFLLLMTFSSTHSTLFHLSVFWWHCSLLQGSAVDWMLVFPQSPMLKCNPQYDALAFGRWIDHEGRGIINGVSALKRDPRKHPPFLHVRTQCFSLTVNKMWAVIRLNLLASWSWTFYSPERWAISFCCFKPSKSLVLKNIFKNKNVKDFKIEF